MWFDFILGLQEALEEHKPLVMDLLEITEGYKIPPIEKAVDEVGDMAARLHARTVATKQAIKSTTEQCIQRLETRCDEMLQTVDELYKLKSKILYDQQSDLQMKLLKNKHACDFVEYAFKHGSEAEIFELFEVMKLRLEKLNIEQLNYKEPFENDVIDHVHETENVDSIADNLGVISTTKVFLANTVLHGSGLHSAKVGIEANFQIDLYNRHAQPCVEWNHDNAIAVKVQAPEGFFINNRVTNNQDGTFTCRYTPVTLGNHQITVKIRGRSFPNNKSVAKVFNGIDYTKVWTLFLYESNKYLLWVKVQQNSWNKLLVFNSLYMISVKNYDY